MKLNNRGMTLIELIAAFAILGMANIERRILNCNEGITWDSSVNGTTSKALYIVNEDTDDNKTLEVIYHKSTTDELFYGTGELTQEGSINLTFYLLAEHVNGMELQLVNTDAAADGSVNVKQAKLKLTMKQNDITYTSEKTIALRNQPSGTYKWTMSLPGNSGTVTPA